MTKKSPTLDQVSGQVYVVNETTKKESLTPAQMAHRISFNSIASAYNLMSKFIGKAYEKRPKEQTDYNQFFKYNLGEVKIYLTKGEWEAGGCVVAPYCISKGTLPSIETSVQGNALVSSIRVPDGFIITDASTVGEVATALLKANRDTLEANDQLTVVHLTQGILGNIPKMFFKPHRFVLDSTSEKLFSEVMPSHLFQINNGYIGTDVNAEAGGVAYVLSRLISKSGEKKLISSQNVVLTPGYTLYEKYSSEASKKKAIESYGLFPVPDYTNPKQTAAAQSGDTDPEDTYFAITGVTLNGTPVVQGSYSLNLSTGEVVVISGTKLTDVGLKARIQIGPTGDPFTDDLSYFGSIVATDNTITVTITRNIEVFYLLRADNEVIVFNFGETNAVYY
ncbi:hypothetical protein EZS27_013455 [termite gut metagenome]|uniref:Uncharacterized protein n=2 Tax=termite gut metagenome TaxID=433724 RepID=A0A5J4RYQ9_9ZZZZ